MREHSPSWIAVHASNEFQQKWLEYNYAKAHNQFVSIHPPYETDVGIHQHGIILRSLNPVSWEIPCHWNSTDHYRQSLSDLMTVLNKLKAPSSLKVSQHPGNPSLDCECVYVAPKPSNRNLYKAPLFLCL